MAEIYPIILNTSLERIAIIDDYSSLIWTSRYYETGDFELCVYVSERNLDLFKKDYYVARDDDENVGIIEDIKIERTEDGAERMIVSGRFLQSILSRRIVAEQTTLSGSVASCINDLLNNNICHPSDSSREISNFTFEAMYYPTEMTAQYTGQNLLDIVSEICKTYGLGFKVRLAGELFIFSVYEGEDRTYDQSVNPWMVFSDKYDNLLSSEYEECYKNQITAVLAAGEGEGLDRKTAWASSGETGLLRREAYKDERNIRSNGGDIDPSEYQELLEESAKESLTKFTTAFTGSIYFGNVVYKQDVFLGDLCVIENSRWNLSINARLVEVIESVSETGEYSITPTFGL